MTDPVVASRIRSQIVDYLGLVSSFEEQTQYQIAAPHINVANEIINQWDDLVHENWRSYIAEPVFSLKEVGAVAKFYTAWDAVATATPHRLPHLEMLLTTVEWQLLASTATEALSIFQARGRIPDALDEA